MKKFEDWNDLNCIVCGLVLSLAVIGVIILLIILGLNFLPHS